MSPAGFTSAAFGSTPELAVLGVLAVLVFAAVVVDPFEVPAAELEEFPPPQAAAVKATAIEPATIRALRFMWCSSDGR